ncbi:MAG TPA: hypothetical protein VJM50_02500 [Pyrinomonadaceae bacterium]|nr:hypothetical protein [Pyrinomonadaceae bacterium]
MGLSWEMVRGMLLGTGKNSLLFQYLVLVVFTLITIYGILAMRHRSVIVLSHARIWIETLFLSLVALGFYRFVLWMTPQGNRNKTYLVMIGVFVFSFVTRWVFDTLLLVVDGGRSLKDLDRGVNDLFNCNWPLISRCANQALITVTVVAVAWTLN